MANIRKNPERDITEQYFRTVESWIEFTQEVLVIIRYLFGAGRIDYALIKNVEDFHRLVELCPEGADIIVFKEPQLPYRGVVSTEFVEGVVKEFKEREEYLYVVTTPEKADDPRLFGEMGYAEESLKSDLLEHKGEVVAVGICPNFIVDDNGNMVSASKGGIDGPR